MIDLFIENPIILLFIVAALGYWIGSFKVRKSSLGVAAVLFVGLGFGALNPDLHIPEIIVFLGLTIFVYTIGLSSGPSFFSSIKRNGFRDIGFVVLMLTFSASVTGALHYLFGFNAATSAGLYSGVTTNTPALAALLDAISRSELSVSTMGRMDQDAVVGYSLSYPMGVLGVMVAIALMQRWLRIDYLKESRHMSQDYAFEQELSSITIEVSSPEYTGITIRDLMQQEKWSLVFGRMQRDQRIFLPNWDTELEAGDLLTIVGSVEETEKVAEVLGKKRKDKLSYDRSEYDIRRFFVSNSKIAGERLASLNLPEKFSAVITRVKRGDIDLLANGDTVLELGDRVRLVARRSDMSRLSKLFGNSYEAQSRINLLSFGLGMALGLILGSITFALPGGLSFKLGFAGGPLIVALILGALRRTGPIVWTLPYSANLTLRQLGLILLLAGIGINSGHTFVETIRQGGGGWIFLSSVVISISSAMATLLIGYKLLKIPFSVLMGMVANQPAILDFAINKSGNKLPNIGFTLMLPIALITKILYVQILFAFLQ